MESFYEPVVLKSDSSLETKLSNLKKYPITHEKDIHMLEMGIAGEKQVEYHLTKSNIGMYIMRDVNLKVDGLKAQIDFIVVTSHHCYFIECKNYNADIIHIDENRNFEISTKYRGRYRKRGIKSPLAQADDQLNVFKRLCLRNKEKVDELLTGINYEDYFKTMVVFANPETRIDNKKSPFDMKYKVLKVDNLIRQIEYDEQHYNGNKLSQTQMLNFANYILSNNVEVKIDEIPQINEYKNYSKNNYYKTNNKSGLNVGAIILVIIIVLSLLSRVGNTNNSNTSEGDSTTNQTTNTTTNKTTTKSNEKVLSDYNIEAINKLKIAYDNSKKYGFDLYDYKYCENLKEIMPKYFNCGLRPMEVTFNNDNSLSIHYYYNCYYLKYDLNNKKILDSSSENVGYENKCPGTDVGVIHYDPSNQYLAKIGGYNKILEMARYLHNNSTNLDSYYDYSHIAERGGSQSLFSNYKSIVDRYFNTITNRNFIQGGTSLEDFNQMIEYYYYIMK